MAHNPYELPPTSGHSTVVNEAPHALTFLANLQNYTLSDLMRIKLEVDRLVPRKSLKDFNLESEISSQLIIAQTLQNDTLNDPEISANQKASTVGQVKAALSQLAGLQKDVYTSERLKRVEQTLIETLNTLPEDTQKLFLGNYERAVKEQVY